MYNLIAPRAKLASSWPLARVEGGSELRLMPPLNRDPGDPRDPVDPRANSKKLDLMRRRRKREPWPPLTPPQSAAELGEALGEPLGGSEGARACSLGITGPMSTFDR